MPGRRLRDSTMLDALACEVFNDLLASSSEPFVFSVGVGVVGHQWSSVAVRRIA
jgi:hypothetical protein